MSPAPGHSRALPNAYWHTDGLKGFADPYRRFRDAKRTAGCGPACPVVWEGPGRARPLPDSEGGPASQDAGPTRREQPPASRPADYPFRTRPATHVGAGRLNRALRRYLGHRSPKGGRGATGCRFGQLHRRAATVAVSRLATCRCSRDSLGRDLRSRFRRCVWLGRSRGPICPVGGSARCHDQRRRRGPVWCGGAAMSAEIALAGLLRRRGARPGSVLPRGRWQHTRRGPRSPRLG